MELTIGERMALLNILPAEGDLTSIKIVRKLRESLSFSEDELKEYKIEVLDGGQVKWDSNAVKNVKIRAKARSLIVGILHKLDDDGKVVEQLLSLFEKFDIGEDDDEDEGPPIAEAA